MIYLTAQERKTVIFVLCLIFLGIGLDFYKKTIKKESLIDYSTLQERIVKKIDINKAKYWELANIPGVGDKLASSIINYRKTKGKLKDIKDLKNIRGIKDKKLKQLKKYIDIEDCP